MTWSSFMVAMRKGASDRTTSATRRAAVQQQRAVGRNHPLSTQTQHPVTGVKKEMEYRDNCILDEYGEPWAVEELQLPQGFGKKSPLTIQQTQLTSVTEALDEYGEPWVVLA